MKYCNQPATRVVHVTGGGLDEIHFPACALHAQESPAGWVETKDQVGVKCKAPILDEDQEREED